jgi:DNA-binding transcriptional regulator YiaG
MITVMPQMSRQAAMTPDAFRALIRSAGMTQGEVAESLGVVRTTVVRWLSGKTPISRANARLISVTIKPKKR